MGDEKRSICISWHRKKAGRENSKSESCEAGVSLTCVIVRFTGCSEWDYYEKNSHKRLDKELPEVFSLQAATAQEVEIEGFFGKRIGEVSL